MAKKKIFYLDLIKVIASIFVVVIHVATQNWDDFPIRSFEWTSFNLFACVARWAAPVFCMISGSLFLDPERTINQKKILTQNAVRSLTAVVFWSIFYMVTIYHDAGYSAEVFWKKTLVGRYHLWFLIMMVGFYLALPLLRKITADVKSTKYFIGLSLFTTFLIPTLLLHPELSWLKTGVNKTFLNITLGYAPYFVLGYYINKFDLRKITKILVYLLGPIGFLGTFLLTFKISRQTGTYFSEINAYNSITVFLETIFVFVLFKDLTKLIKIPEKCQKVVSTLAKYNLGIYIIHPFLITTLYETTGICAVSVDAIVDLLEKYTSFDAASLIPLMTKFEAFTGINNALSALPLLMIPILSIIVYFVSFTLSWILKKIPIIKTYLV